MLQLQDNTNLLIDFVSKVNYATIVNMSILDNCAIADVIIAFNDKDCYCFKLKQQNSMLFKSEHCIKRGYKNNVEWFTINKFEPIIAGEEIVWLNEFLPDCF